ncbi:MAG: hypothetical protein AAF763_19440 [Pseudomonadota bacterium]
MRLATLAAAAAALLLHAGPASAVFLDPLARGFVDDLGAQNGYDPDQNITTGFLQAVGTLGRTTRSFFVFDVSPLAGRALASAVLRFEAGEDAGDRRGEFRVARISGAELAKLAAEAGDGTTFSELGAGDVLASFDLDLAARDWSGGGFEAILPPAAFAGLASAPGGRWGVGAAFEPASAASSDQLLFLRSDDQRPGARLSVTFATEVPLPAAAPALLLGLGALGWAARRRRA